MEQRSAPILQANSHYYGGTIGIPTTPKKPSLLIEAADKSHTYFCIAMLVLLDIASVLFPRSIGATAVSYKIREFLLIFAFTSFAWSMLKKMKIWEYPKSMKIIAYGVTIFVLLILCTGMFFFHGIEERTDKELQARPYMQK